MDEFYEYLGKVGIFNPPDVFEVVNKLSIKKIIELSVQCYKLTEISSEKDINNSIFNFSASSTMSGGVSPCAEVNCRVNNVYELAAFSALYADKVVIPSPFEHIYHNLSSDFKFANEEQLYFFINRLIGDIVIMLNLKPLFKNKLLTINPRIKRYCSECYKRQLSEEKKVQNAFKKIEKEVINDLNRNIKFTLDTKKSIITKGTKNYIGKEVLQFSLLPKKLKPYTKFVPYTFNSEEIKKIGLWRPVVIPIFEDLILQKYLMQNYNTTYLTNRRLEADIISRLENNSSEQSKTKAIIDGLVHRLPFLENASLNTLVKLRNNEQEAFAVYRNAVTETIKGVKGETNSKNIKEMVEEKIQPELKKLDQIFRNHRDNFRARGTEKIILSSLLLSAGFFVNKISGISIGSILEAGGAYKMTEIYSDLSQANKVPQDVKNSDYYFLWNLERKFK